MLGVHSNVEHTQGWYVTFTADDGSIYDINSSKKCKITLNPGKEKGYPCVDTVWSQEFNVGKFAYSGLGTLGAELIYYMGQLKGG
ncbi:hypothetical protein FACS1894166_11380 [Bacilli bacterium]|nr:hypothetical protein FACS1894166_11380 [Bacilli bacterium]